MSDQLTTWQQVRQQIPWRDVVAHLQTPVRAIRDGFATHAAIGDDQRRQSLLLTAYDDVRCAAATGVSLTPDLTARWNAMLRGIPGADFRGGPAFAKNGRDRYGLNPDTPQRYESCLSEAADVTIPVAARAARSYLDVAFFHPYGDGNARLGGLVMHFVLLSAGVELDEAHPILTIVRRADDREGAAGLARLVHGIATATHRRWLRSTSSGLRPATPLPAAPHGTAHNDP